jgi:hypothetical protein
MSRPPIAILLPLLLLAAAAQAQDLPAARPFHVGGFADLELHTTSDNEREGLDLAELDIFSTYQLSNAWSALGEAVLLRSWRDPDEKFDVDLERLYVEYSTSDALRVEIGETQTGIIRWNEREHRSRFLQTPIDLPAIARRPQDDGAWPQRFAGIFASGRLPGSLGVSWGAGAGAGPGRVRDSTPLTSDGRSPAALLSLSTAPDALPGLELAAAAYVGDVRLNPGHIREHDVTLSASYVASGNEVRAEWARMNHRLSSAPSTYRTTGYYALFSRRLAGRAERFRPYVLLDRLTIAPGEAYLSEAADENAWATGIRCDVTQRFSVKAEYRSQRTVNGDRETIFGVQLGLSF